jgi:hypothetical protein
MDHKPTKTQDWNEVDELLQREILMIWWRWYLWRLFLWGERRYVRRLKEKRQAEQNSVIGKTDEGKVGYQ